MSRNILSFKCIFLYLLFLSGTSKAISAGIFPHDGSTLSSIHVMFGFEDIYGSDRYELIVYNKEKKATTPPLFRISTKYISLLVKEGLQFGHQYQWQFMAYKKGNLTYTSPFYHFSILTSPRIDSARYRQEVVTAINPGSDLLLIDHSAIAIDRQGRPVWFLPLANDSMEKWTIRDLNLTPSGTITHLDTKGAYEKKPDGTLLWTGPGDGRIAGNTKEDYHHQLSKLADGSYIVCGFITKPGKRSSTGNDIRYNTIIHYEADGKIRRSWNELNSLESDSLFAQHRQNTFASHLNGFALTPGHDKMFLSFKNLSDVYVLNLTTGLFETSIKKDLAPGIDFKQQHGPFYTRSNELLIYNNNLPDDSEEKDGKQTHPSVMAFRYDTVKKRFSFAWQAPVQADRYPQGINGKEGYVSETGNNNILVCAGGANYTAEITKTGKKIWECYFYKRTSTDTSWKPYSNYRCHSIASLYPLWHSLQYAGKKNGQHSFRLYNAGSNAVSFELKFTGQNSATVVSYNSATLSPGSSQVFTVPAKWATAENIACTVTPVSVKAASATYTYKTSLLK